MPPSTISAIEEGRLTPSQITGNKLVKGLGVRPDAIDEVVASYIISGEGQGRGQAARFM